MLLNLLRNKIQRKLPSNRPVGSIASGEEQKDQNCRLFPFYTIDKTTSEKLRNNDRGIVQHNDKIDCKFVNSCEHNFVSTRNAQPVCVFSN